MSKSLRTFLLSVFIVVLAVSSAMAANIKFVWKDKAATNYWGNASNWDIFSGDEGPVSYDAVKGSIKELKNDIEFYPGNFYVDSTDKTKVYVVISKDVTIDMTGAGHDAGGLTDITSIEVCGGTSSKKVNVVLNMGSGSWFEKAPSINISPDSGLTINGSHATAFKIVEPVEWKGVSADNMVFNMPVSFASNDAVLSLDAEYSTLTIGNTTLIDHTGKMGKTSIIVSDDKTSPNAKLVFNVAFNGASTMQSLDIKLENTANRVETNQDVTLYVHSEDIREAISTDAAKFIKGGTAALTLIKSNDLYGRQGISVVSADTFEVAGGTLVISGEAAAPIISHDHNKLTFTVTSGTLDLGKKTISADVSIDIIVNNGGTVLFRESAVDTGDVYDGGELKISADVSIDVKSGGRLVFGGSQAVRGVRGAGTIESEVEGAMLLLRGTSSDIENFTGTINGLNVGITTSWDVFPFLNNEDVEGTINTLYVFGPDGSLSLDKKLLNGLDVSDTTVHLRSNMPGVGDYQYLSSLKIGQLFVSGDITLGALYVDGTRSSSDLGAVTFASGTSADNKLTLGKLVIHANADPDFKASTLAAQNANVYTQAYAIDIKGPGTFAPKAIENGAVSEEIKVGATDSITVEDGATLQLRGGVTFPVFNGLLLKASSIDVANNTKINGNFIIDGDSIIKVALTGANNRDFEGEENINTAAIVVTDTFKISGDTRISVDIEDLADDTKFLGKMYNLIGYNTLDLGSEDKKPIEVSIDVIGDYGATASRDAAIEVGLAQKVLYAQLVKWMIKPVVYEWEYESADMASTLGGASSQFRAVISYGVSDDITPKDDLLNCLKASAVLYYDGQPAVPQLVEGIARQNVRTADGEPLGFFKFENLSKDHKLVLSGTSYKTELEVGITLSWDMSATSLATYEAARVTTPTSGTLGASFDHNGKVEPEDLLNLEDERRVLKNPVKSGSVTTEQPVASESGSTFTAGDPDAVFEFIIPGMRIAPANNTTTIVFENGRYVWKRNAVSATDTYIMTDTDGNTYNVKGEDIKITVDGQEIDITNVTITNTADGTGVIVSIPVTLLGGADGANAAQKSVQLTATADDEAGTPIVVPSVMVEITAGVTYPTGTVADGESEVTFVNGGDASEPHVVGDATNEATPLSGEISYTVRGDGNTEGINWNNAGGVVSYTLSPDIAVGTYNVMVDVYDANGTGYTYAFKITVTEPETPSELAVTGDKEAVTVTLPDGTDTVTLTLPDGATNLAISADSTYPAGLVTLSGTTVTVDAAAEGVTAGTYTYFFTAEAESGDVTPFELTVTVNPEVVEEFDEIELIEDSGFDDPIAGHTYYATFRAKGTTLANEVTWNVVYEATVDDEALAYVYRGEHPHFAVSGDVFVVEGVVTEGQTEDEEQGFIVTATSGDVTLYYTDVVFTVTPDEITSYTELEAAAGSHTAVAAGYRVDFPDGVTADPADVFLPSWLAPVLNDEGEVIGVEFAGVVGDMKNASAGTVRIEATDDDGNDLYYGWDVVYAAQPPFDVTADKTTLSIDLHVKSSDTVTLTPVNANGTVNYTASETWVTVDPETGVATFAPTATGSYTVTITATDTGNNVKTVTVAVSVTRSGDVPPEPDNGSFDLTASSTTLTVAVNTTATVTLTPVNANGTVNYTASETWVTVDPETGVATFAPTATGSYTVTITATDTGRTTDNIKTVTVAVTVTQPAPSAPVVSVSTNRISNTNMESVDVTADHDVTSWQVYVNGSEVDWAVIAATGTRTARVVLDVPFDLDAGTYTVTVTATNANGTSTSTSVGSFTVPERTGLGSSGGGCDAGFGALALALAAPLFLRRRRS